MIKCKEDYRRFLRAEQFASGSTQFLMLYLRTSFQPTLRFLLLLRTCEYLRNAKRGPQFKILYLLVKYLKHRLATRLGFSIPENVADEGLQLPHYGTIVVNTNARLGKYCRVHVCVNIGASAGGKEAPLIGNQVYFGPGAKVYGDITIADRIAIAANAAVATSFGKSDVIIGGVPAKELGTIDITTLIPRYV
jgi:serine O-acetyltransferase